MYQVWSYKSIEWDKFIFTGRLIGDGVQEWDWALINRFNLHWHWFLTVQRRYTCIFHYLMYVSCLCLSIWTVACHVCCISWMVSLKCFLGVVYFEYVSVFWLLLSFKAGCWYMIFTCSMNVLNPLINGIFNGIFYESVVLYTSGVARPFMKYTQTF